MDQYTKENGIKEYNTGWEKLFTLMELKDKAIFKITSTKARTDLKKKSKNS